MRHVTISGVKRSLEVYIQEVKKGKGVLVGRYGKPEVELIYTKPAKKRLLTPQNHHESY